MIDDSAIDLGQPNRRPRSALLDLLNQHSVDTLLAEQVPDLGLAEHRPFPFMALVGQDEMRLALLLAVINPAVSGVLLIGPRGTGKTTAVRSLTGILPAVEVSDCDEGALPADIEANPQVAEALFPDCYEKYKAGETISHYESVKLVELPLTARLEDVVGGINERVAVQKNKIRLERGLLARADNNILYVDEVNLLDNTIIDAILDAASAGSYSVRRGPMVGTYRSRFVLVGSMNPEEGGLRPQIMDRFGLRVGVRGLFDPAQRYEVYRRMQAYRINPTAFIQQWEWATADALQEVQVARERLSKVDIPQKVLSAGFELVRQLDIDSHRADYVMFETARAYAAADARETVMIDDLRAVAPLALRQRRSAYMVQYFEEQQKEDEGIHATLETILKKPSRKSTKKRGVDDSSRGVNPSVGE
jgi:magnesium chelatase subunit I